MDVDINAHDDSIHLTDYGGKPRLLFINDSLIALRWILSRDDYQLFQLAGGRNLRSWELERRDDDGNILNYLRIDANFISDTYVKVEISGHIGDIDSIHAAVDAHYHFPHDDWYKLLDGIVEYFEDSPE